MSEDEVALLRMILDNPDDDMPRLVYADWLEEHDLGERATEIRQQITDPRPTPALCHGLQATFTRGFATEIVCTMTEWNARGQAICLSHPIQKVTITDRVPDSHNGNFCWCFRNKAHDCVYPEDLPPWFYDGEFEGGCAWGYFGSAVDAIAWLNDYALEWAKEQESA